MSCDGTCDVCNGTGKPISRNPCICQGGGSCQEERVGLRERVIKAEDDLYQVAKYAVCAYGAPLGCNCIVCHIRRKVEEAVSR